MFLALAVFTGVSIVLALVINFLFIMRRVSISVDVYKL